MRQVDRGAIAAGQQEGVVAVDLGLAAAQACGDIFCGTELKRNIVRFDLLDRAPIARRRARPGDDTQAGQLAHGRGRVERPVVRRDDIDLERRLKYQLTPGRDAIWRRNVVGREVDNRWRTLHFALVARAHHSVQRVRAPHSHFFHLKNQ
ncbi:MAG TPA: hypothetical protein VKB08_15570 [Bradyrhizobium sp.]|nr:hypothetical protein [Bradyrhizobium sp.]